MEKEDNKSLFTNFLSSIDKKYEESKKLLINLINDEYDTFELFTNEEFKSFLYTLQVFVKNPRNLAKFIIQLDPKGLRKKEKIIISIITLLQILYSQKKIEQKELLKLYVNCGINLKYFYEIICEKMNCSSKYNKKKIKNERQFFLQEFTNFIRSSKKGNIELTEKEHKKENIELTEKEHKKEYIKGTVKGDKKENVEGTEKGDKEEYIEGTEKNSKLIGIKKEEKETHIDFSFFLKIQHTPLLNI